VKFIDHFIFGSLLIIVAAVMLFYWLSCEPATIESYYVTDISYSNCYYDANPKDRKIILESGEKKYNLSYYMWQDHSGPVAIATELGKYSRAKVWLTAKDESGIRGIATPTLTIDPSVGVKWDRANRQAMLNLILSFSAVGLGLFVFMIFKANRAA
jgi:hypothetical protein